VLIINYCPVHNQFIKGGFLDKEQSFSRFGAFIFQWHILMADKAYCREDQWVACHEVERPVNLNATKQRAINARTNRED